MTARFPLLRQYGVRGVLKKALLRPVGRFVAINRVLFYETGDAPDGTTAHVRLARASASTLARLVKSGLVRTPMDTIRARLKQDHECILLYAGSDEPCGYGWIAYGVLHEDGVDMTIPLGSDEIFLYDFRIAPERRGVGLYPAIILGMLSLARRARHIQTAYIATHAENRASRLGIGKAGFALAFETHYWRVASLRFRRYIPRGGGVSLLARMRRGPR